MITAEVEIVLDSPLEARAIYHAVKPELGSSITGGVALRRAGQKLSLSFKSPDATSMRASVNSVLRWIITSSSVCKLARRD
jgi:tRNA threonylcarbamoyladenosine modification (KEOPS) complex  Pcc1 subunit